MSKFKLGDSVYITSINELGRVVGIDTNGYWIENKRSTIAEYSTIGGSPGQFLPFRGFSYFVTESQIELAAKKILDNPITRTLYPEAKILGDGWLEIGEVYED